MGKFRVEYELEGAYVSGERFLHGVNGFNYRLPDDAKVTDITPPPPNGWYQCTDECDRDKQVFFVCNNEVYEVFGSSWNKPSLVAYSWDWASDEKAAKELWFRAHKLIQEK